MWRALVDVLGTVIVVVLFYCARAIFLLRDRVARLEATIEGLIGERRPTDRR